ncbi:MAG: hypothetical protein JW395_2916 [Nitrospira sp.]|nr:hypothetical protein [Nitrospira sp.]
MFHVIAAEVDGLFDGIESRRLFPQFEKTSKVRAVVANLQDAVCGQVVRPEVDGSRGIVEIYTDLCSLQQRDTLALREKARRPSGPAENPLRERRGKPIEPRTAPRALALAKQRKRDVSSGSGDILLSQVRIVISVAESQRPETSILASPGAVIRDRGDVPYQAEVIR